MIKLVKEKRIKDEGVKGVPHAKAGDFVPARASWRTHKPVIDHKKCIKCLNCWVRCPDAAYKIDKNGYPRPDMKFCKGCLICVRECPVRCIKAEREERK